ncbi:hypothetical protein Ancab_029204 [Ancistrocladus abbreviatus]
MLALQSMGRLFWLVLFGPVWVCWSCITCYSVAVEEVAASGRADVTESEPLFPFVVCCLGLFWGIAGWSNSLGTETNVLQLQGVLHDGDSRGNNNDTLADQEIEEDGVDEAAAPPPKWARIAGQRTCDYAAELNELRLLIASVKANLVRLCRHLDIPVPDSSILQHPPSSHHLRPLAVPSCGL